MRKTFIIILCCIAVLLTGYVGYRSYKVWKCSHLMGLAHQFLAKADIQNAGLCVQQVLRSDPHNLDATRMMAQLSERVRSPGTLLWWNRVVELNPQSLNDRLSLAQAAILMHDYTMATNALAGVSGADKNSVDYHIIAGSVAAAGNQLGHAETEFLEAARLDPENQRIQLSLAVVRLSGTNNLDQAEARISLQRISLNTTNAFLRCQALRELANDAMRHHRNDEALSLSQQLVQDTNSAFQDRLLRLRVLQDTKSTAFRPTLASFQREASGDPAKIFELTMWQMTRTSPGDALNWLQSLPPNTQTNQTVELLTAQCCTVLHEWAKLQTTIQMQNWGELEYARHAFLSRALRGQGLADSSKAEWELALQGAGNEKVKQAGLLQLAVQWNWQSEGEEILWTIVNRYPDEQSAMQTLVKLMYADGRTRSLMQLFVLQLKRNPSDLSAKNDLAMTALLLDARELKPYDLAREVHEQSPTDASYAATYAFSLYLQGKNADALAVMKALKTQDLQTPSIAGYYGLILKATGDRVRAKTYLDWAFKGTMLPEEKKLFNSAKVGL
jgi:Flp pilus assembly protein TadD